MAIYHLSVKTFSRSNGQSAVAAAAYRACQKLVNVVTGEVADFTRKSGLFLSKIFVPPGAPEPTRQDLWNLAESTENRKNSTLAREWELALPEELSDGQRAELAESFCFELVTRYSVAVDLCIHRPGRGGREDDRNHHAHILTTTRAMLTDGTLGAKTRQLDDLKTGEVKIMRERWADLCNAALERAGHTVRVSHLSHRDRGLSDLLLPTVKQGNGPSAARRRAKNAEIRHINATLPVLKKERARAHAAELAARFIKPTPPLRKDAHMTPETAQKITARIDSLLAKPGTTLENLRVQLRPLGVIAVEDRGDDFYWNVEGKSTAEKDLGQQYTRAALLARGLLLEEPKSPLGFLSEAEYHKPSNFEDEDLYKALQALGSAIQNLGVGVRNLFAKLINLILRALKIDYRLEMKEGVPVISGNGEGPPDGKARALSLAKDTTLALEQQEPSKLPRFEEALNDVEPEKMDAARRLIKSIRDKVSDALLADLNADLQRLDKTHKAALKDRVKIITGELTGAPRERALADADKRVASLEQAYNQVLHKLHMKDPDRYPDPYLLVDQMEQQMERQAGK